MNKFEKQLHSIFGKGSKFDEIFGRSAPTTKRFQLIWKNGDQEVIEGETLSGAWNLKGWDRARIQELSSYKEL